MWAQHMYRRTLRAYDEERPNIRERRRRIQQSRRQLGSSSRMLVGEEEIVLSSSIDRNSSRDLPLTAANNVEDSENDVAGSIVNGNADTSGQEIIRSNFSDMDEDDDVTVIEIEDAFDSVRDDVIDLSRPRRWMLGDGGNWIELGTMGGGGLGGGIVPTRTLAGMLSSRDPEAEERRRCLIETEIERVQRTNFCHFMLLCLVPTSLLLVVLVGALRQNTECSGLSPHCANEARKFVNAFTTRCICDAVCRGGEC